MVVVECGGDEDEEVDGVSPADLHPGVQDVTEIVRKPKHKKRFFLNQISQESRNFFATSTFNLQTDRSEA